jgi:hypothetical protein
VKLVFSLIDSLGSKCAMMPRVSLRSSVELMGVCPFDDSSAGGVRCDEVWAAAFRSNLAQGDQKVEHAEAEHGGD